MKTFQARIEQILSPAIDVKAPYSKVMVAQVVEAAQREANRHAAEIERLKIWVADLQSDMFINCVYCGHRYGPHETTPVSAADALKAHITECPEHPLSRATALLESAYHALRSYEFGNGSPDLAKSVCETLLGFGLKPKGGS